jgi:hypothetical protein
MRFWISSREGERVDDSGPLGVWIGCGFNTEFTEDTESTEVFVEAVLVELMGLGGFGRLEVRAGLEPGGPKPGAEHLDGGAVAVEGADVDVLFAGTDAESEVAVANPGVDKGAEIFVAFLATAPEIVQLFESVTGHFERAPNPFRCGVGALDLDFENVALFVRDDGVEILRLFNREEQERKNVVGKFGEAVFRKPNRVGKANERLFVILDEVGGLENGVAEAGGFLLDDVGEVDVVVAPAVIFEDVGFSGRDDETDLVGAAADHALDEIFADGARTFGVRFVEAAAHGQELF